MNSIEQLPVYLVRPSNRFRDYEKKPGIYIQSQHIDRAWNDNGYFSNVAILIKTATDNVLVTGYIGFIDINNPLRDLDEDNDGLQIVSRYFKENNIDYIDLKNNSGSFYIMLKSSAEYRLLIKSFGLEAAQTILKKINDVILTKELNTSSEFITKLEDRSIFKYSFLRHSSSWFAWHNAGTILRGLNEELFDVISSSMHIQFKRENMSTPHEITFNFNLESLISQRIAVIIGKNGIGKSQTLAEIASALIAKKDNFFVPETHQRVMVNRLLAFSPSKEVQSLFPEDGRTTRQPEQYYDAMQIYYRRFLLNPNTIPRSRLDRDFIVNDILKLARVRETLGNRSRWDIFRAALHSIDNSHEIALAHRSDDGFITLDELANIYQPWPGRVRIDSFNDVLVYEEPFRQCGDRRYPLSSGERNFLAFAAQACCHIDNGTLVLIDEPETHLHPQFISQFANLLFNLLEMSGSVAIVATHSVYFVREVSQKQVIVLRQKNEDEITVDVPILKTLGADVGAISWFVFGQEQQTPQVERITAILLEKYRTEGWEALARDYGHLLASELLSSLRIALEGSNE
ncbi:Predicted ATPase [Kosakonia arachidis]|uniref:Predicted ATPase n=1 Tax=Kosakonia arachidis TaxID=551989 RepID=A0A1I6ZX03_9ENTR|nr:AAA family ATPase [Kosakonia arachidis]SFT67250.1 Predicted ATPase [Kosakonia arachidis]